MAEQGPIVVKVRIHPEVHRQAVKLARKTGLPRQKVYAMAIGYAVQSVTFYTRLLNLELEHWRAKHPNGLD